MFTSKLGSNLSLLEWTLHWSCWRGVMTSAPSGPQLALVPTRDLSKMRSILFLVKIIALLPNFNFNPRRSLQSVVPCISLIHNMIGQNHFDIFDWLAEIQHFLRLT